MSGLTVGSNLSPAVQAWYDKRFLLRAKQELAGYQFAQKKALPGGSGKTVYWSRYVPLAKVTSSLTETVDGGITVGSEKQLTTEEVSATVAAWGDYVKISRLADLTALGDPAVTDAVDVIGQQAGESIDAYVLKKLATGINRRRADADATYQVEGTAGSGTVTTLVDNALTQADDFWKGGYLIITAGTNYGLVRKISGFTASSDTVTVDTAFPKAIDTTSKYRIVIPTGTAATDVPTTTNIRLAIRDLMRAKAMRFEKGYWIGLLNDDVEYDWFGDDTFIKAAEYRTDVKELYEGEIGRRLGVRWVRATQAYREDVDGTANESGAVHSLTLLGKESYGVVELEGGAKKIYVKTPEQLAQPIPLYSTCGWESVFEAMVLNGMFSIDLLCGATA